MSAGSCSSIDVSALSSPPSGIQFSTDLAVLGASSADAALTFSVSAPNGINDVGLSFNSTFLGTDINSVTENIYAQGGNLVGYGAVFCGPITGCSGSTLSDIALTGTYTDLYITKDINLSSFPSSSGPVASLAADSYGSTSIITQTFANTASPEPVSILLTGGGLLSLIGLWKRTGNIPFLRK